MRCHANSFRWFIFGIAAMDSVRWGILGAGDVCERKSGPPLYQVLGSELVLIHRRDSAAGTDFVRRHAGRYVADIREVYESPDIDAIYVATPHEYHAEQTIQALESGKHVLVEKPMALTTADCDTMIDAARSADRSLGVAYYRRGYPSIQHMRTLIKTDAIGEIISMSINAEFPTSHRLDLVHYLLGDIDRVRTNPSRGTGYYFELLGETFELTMKSGSSVRLSSHWSETGMPEAIYLKGESGSIHLTDLKGGELIVRGVDDDNSNFRIEHPGDLPYTHTGLIENFVAHLIDGAPLLCDGNSGRKSTVILDALAAGDSGDEWTNIRY